jgi:serine/threonine protein kinase/FixJ family two-component response regulator
MDNQQNILLINRDADFLEATRESLSKVGYTIFTAMNMRSALTSLTQSPINLIICDNALEDVSGYDFLHYLKCDPLRENIPFIFFVPVNDQGNAFKSFKLGAVDFLVYPLERDDLLSRIGKILSDQGKEGIDSAETARTDDLPYDEKRETKRDLPLPPVKVEVSRDGILWMPGQIRNFNHDGIFLKTSLLDKPDAILIMRFGLPKGPVMVQGKIIHVNFDNPQEPPGIGLKIDDCEEWQSIHDYLKSFIGLKNDINEDERTPAEPAEPDQMKGTGTIVVSGPDLPTPEDVSLSTVKKEKKEEPLDLRFYNSLVGKQIDNYKLVSFIGGGNMGGVFKGWDVSLEREVAVKIISFDLSSQEKFREMFIKEARTASRLDHPNIAHIYSIGNAQDILYFAMEYVSGVTLLSLIRKGTNLNTLLGLEYLITICETLSFMKEKNVIHRDIKPENIMVTPAKNIKLVDFGIAQLADGDRKESAEGIMGSPFYISPECIEGGAIDHRSDIYSLGATFYHAFCGSPPYESESMDEILIQHLNGNLPSLKGRNPKVSKLLAQIVEKMMTREIESRYQDYKEIINDLLKLRDKAMQFLHFKKQKNTTLIFEMKQKKMGGVKASKLIPKNSAQVKAPNRQDDSQEHRAAPI